MSNFSMPLKVLATHIQQYWIGNRDAAVRNIRRNVSDALNIKPDQLLIYDEREVIISYMRHQANAIRSHFTIGSQATTSVIIAEIADAVDAMAHRIQNGEHIELILGEFALCPQDIKRLSRARNGHIENGSTVSA